MNEFLTANWKAIVTVVALLAIAGCSLFRRQPGDPVNLADIADDIEFARSQTMLFAQTKASPELLAKLQALSDQVLEVEGALIAAQEDGGITDWKSAASAAFLLGGQVVEYMEKTGTNTGDVAFWLALAQAGLKELADGHSGAAKNALEHARAERQQPASK